MLSSLSSLFSPDKSESGGVDKALIELATERTVDGTDPGLRAPGSYRKQLLDQKLTTMKNGGWGLESMLSPDAEPASDMG